GVSLGELGVLLSIGSIGALLGQFVINHVIERLKERRTALLAQVVLAIAYTFLGLSVALLGNVTLAAISLFIVAFGLASTGIVINLEAAAVDRASGRT